MCCILTGFAHAAPKIFIDPASMNVGKLYVDPETDPFMQNANPCKSICIISNRGDSPLDVTFEYGNRGRPITLQIGPGVRQKVEYAVQNPKLGINQSDVVISSNDPVKPRIDMPVTYEGIPQPPLLVLNRRGSPLLSGNTSIDLGSILLNNSNPSKEVPNKASRIIQVRNTGDAVMPLRSGDVKMVQGDSIVTFVPAIAYSDFVFIKPKETLSLEVTLNPTRAGRHEVRVPISNDWGSSDDSAFVFSLIGKSVPVSDLAVLDKDGREYISSLGFPLKYQGEKDVGLIGIANYGLVDLVVDAEVVGENRKDYEILTKFPIRLKSSELREVEIRFAPRDGGPRPATLRLSSNDPDSKRFDLSLKGEAFGLTLAPSSDPGFKDVVIGTSAIRKFTLRNTGSRTMTSISANFRADQDQELSILNKVPYSLAPGKSAEITVRYTPIRKGNDFADLVVTSLQNLNKPLTQRIAMSGIFAPSLLLVAEDGKTSADGGKSMNVPFGPVNLQTSKVLSFEIKNGGSRALNLRSRFAGSNSPDFSLQAPLAKSLAPGEKTTFEIQFRPSAGGAKRAVFEILSNDPYLPAFSLNLNGSGSSLSVDTPQGTQFGDLALGRTQQLTFVLTNLGNTPLEGVSVVFESSGGKEGSKPRPQDFTLASSIPSTLAPRQRVGFRVSFKPQAGGLRTARMLIKSNLVGEIPISVGLSGKGLSPKIGVTNPAGKILVSGKSLEASRFSEGSSKGRQTMSRVGIQKFRSITVNRFPNSGLAPIVEVSSDLIHWQSGKNHTVLLASTPTLLKVRDKTPLTKDSKRYIRVRYVPIALQPALK